MRLVCPNCDAEYEVDDGVVPAEGRDVQCSNCTTTWFQAAAAVAEDADAPEVEADTEVLPEIEPEVEVDVEAEPEAEADDETLLAAAAASAAMTASPTPRKPAIDPEALEVIHEEVERETAARQAERGGIETQPDLGLDDTETQERASAARDRMARRRGIAPTADTIEDNDEVLAAAPKRDETAAKKELFPDIEEINSTLSPETAEAEAEAERLASEGGSLPERRAHSSYRTGFGLMLLLAVGLLLLYVYAPQISRSVPAAADPLESYVSAVDGGRVWLDTLVQGLVDQIGTTLESQPAE